MYPFCNFADIMYSMSKIVYRIIIIKKYNSNIFFFYLHLQDMSLKLGFLFVNFNVRCCSQPKPYSTFLIEVDVVLVIGKNILHVCLKKSSRMQLSFFVYNKISGLDVLLLLNNFCTNQEDRFLRVTC